MTENQTPETPVPEIPVPEIRTPATPERSPWWEILGMISKIIDTANGLVNSWNTRSFVPMVDAGREMRAHTDAVLARFKVLEDAARDQMNLMKQTAEQLQAISLRLAGISRRASLGMWFGIGALAISCATLLFVILR